MLGGIRGAQGSRTRGQGKGWGLLPVLGFGEQRHILFLWTLSTPGHTASREEGALVRVQPYQVVSEVPALQGFGPP